MFRCFWQILILLIWTDLGRSDDLAPGNDLKKIAGAIGDWLTNPFQAAGHLGFDFARFGLAQVGNAVDNALTLPSTGSKKSKETIKNEASNPLLEGLVNTSMAPTTTATPKYTKEGYWKPVKFDDSYRRKVQEYQQSLDIPKVDDKSAEAGIAEIEDELLSPHSEAPQKFTADIDDALANDQLYRDEKRGKSYEDFELTHSTKPWVHTQAYEAPTRKIPVYEESTQVDESSYERTNKKSSRLMTATAETTTTENPEVAMMREKMQRLEALLSKKHEKEVFEKLTTEVPTTTTEATTTENLEIVEMRERMRQLEELMLKQHHESTVTTKKSTTQEPTTLTTESPEVIAMREKMQRLETMLTEQQELFRKKEIEERSTTVPTTSESTIMSTTAIPTTVPSTTVMITNPIQPQIVIIEKPIEPKPKTDLEALLSVLAQEKLQHLDSVLKPSTENPELSMMREKMQRLEGLLMEQQELMIRKEIEEKYTNLKRYNRRRYRESDEYDKFEDFAKPEIRRSPIRRHHSSDDKFKNSLEINEAAISETTFFVETLFIRTTSKFFENDVASSTQETSSLVSTTSKINAELDFEAITTVGPSLETTTQSVNDKDPVQESTMESTRLSTTVATKATKASTISELTTIEARPIVETTPASNLIAIAGKFMPSEIAINDASTDASSIDDEIDGKIKMVSTSTASTTPEVSTASDTTTESTKITETTEEIPTSSTVEASTSSTESTTHGSATIPENNEIESLTTETIKIATANKFLDENSMLQQILELRRSLANDPSQTTNDEIKKPPVLISIPRVDDETGPKQESEEITTTDSDDSSTISEITLSTSTSTTPMTTTTTNAQRKSRLNKYRVTETPKVEMASQRSVSNILVQKEHPSFYDDHVAVNQTDLISIIRKVKELEARLQEQRQDFESKEMDLKKLFELLRSSKSQKRFKELMKARMLTMTSTQPSITTTRKNRFEELMKMRFHQTSLRPLTPTRISRFKELMKRRNSATTTTRPTTTMDQKSVIARSKWRALQSSRSLQNPRIRPRFIKTTPSPIKAEEPIEAPEVLSPSDFISKNVKDVEDIKKFMSVLEMFERLKIN